MSYSLWCTGWSNPFTSLVSVACVWCCWCYLHYSVQIPEKRKEKHICFMQSNHKVSRCLAHSENCPTVVLLIFLQFNHHSNKLSVNQLLHLRALCQKAVASKVHFNIYDQSLSFKKKKSCINVKARMSIWTPPDLKTPNETCPFYNQKMCVRKTFTLVCSTAAAPCTLATVTRYTSVFNDAITSTASAMSGSVIFKDIRCVCFLSWISYTNSWTNPCCSCCGKEMIPFVTDPQNLELKGSQWKKCSLWAFPMWCLLLSGRACDGFSRAF